MRILRFTSNILALGVLALGFASMANAQASRTWVSGLGDDANPCSRTAPCKTFPGAYSKTAAGGEIDCLDPGGFGQVSISKSITIDCDTGPGGILAISGSGIAINAGPGDTVVIRSVNVNCFGGATDGVHINSAKAVHLIDMNIWNCSGSGVSVTASATVLLTIKDTQIHEVPTGVSASATAGLVVGDFDHIAIWGITNGIAAGNAAHLNIHGSTIFGATIAINNNGGGGSAVSVVNNLLSNNSTAVQSIAGGNVGVSGNVIIGSSPVYNTNGGTISTGSDNTSILNGAIGVTNGPPISKI